MIKQIENKWHQLTQTVYYVLNANIFYTIRIEVTVIWGNIIVLTAISNVQNSLIE